MEDQSYSQEELLRVRGNEFPGKGLLCPMCKVRIPAFRDLTPQDETRLRTLIQHGRPTEATKRLIDATGCNLPWANIWVLHPDGPHDPATQPTAPCPYCGEALRTPPARQCRFCEMDWHDPEHVYRREA
ncbi:MAG: hypothetical protein H7Y22_02290 [Gemmatimonadaceae bacterium]|nr:hypothetical protein [Gloeobacterales cyanobacterium ES-bin-141]